MSACDVVIVGAGPYGLSAAAHLSKIKGLEVQVFGDPMSFWDGNMPKGMLLRSNWTATQIGAPDPSLSLEAFQAETGARFAMPVPLERFVEYGRWYQKRAVPQLDRRRITRVDLDPRGFRVTPEKGEAIITRRVIVAVGIGAFAWRPTEFHEVPRALASHTSEHRDLAAFANKEVLVLGSGQSALESAALLAEGGAKAEVFGRAQRIHWLQGRLSKLLHHGSGTVVRKLLYAPTDVGPAGLSQLLARPDLVKRLPRGLQNRLRKRAVRPAGARWLVNRLASVPIHLGCKVASAKAKGDRITVTFADGTERTVDHVLLGTGYRPNVSKYGFLSPTIAQSIDCANGFPRLKAGLETSVQRLHILGAPGVWTFGPLMQFVSGTTYASRSLTRAVAAGR